MVIFTLLSIPLKIDCLKENRRPLVYPDETCGLPKLGNPVSGNRATSPLPEGEFCVVVREMDEPMPASASAIKERKVLLLDEFGRFSTAVLGNGLGGRRRRCSSNDLN